LKNNVLQKETFTEAKKKKKKKRQKPSSPKLVMKKKVCWEIHNIQIVLIMKMIEESEMIDGSIYMREKITTTGIRLKDSCKCCDEFEC
jgi:hypothetical protein